MAHKTLQSSHAIALPSGPAPEWVHLIPAGEFSGRDGRGPYKSNPQSVLDQFASWGILTDTDMPGLLAMLDHLKSNDDEPMILIPQSTRPEEAWPVRVVLDEIEMPEDGGYQPNTGSERRYGMKLSVKGVVA